MESRKSCSSSHQEAATRDSERPAPRSAGITTTFGLNASFHNSMNLGQDDEVNFFNSNVVYSLDHSQMAHSSPLLEAPTIDDFPLAAKRQSSQEQPKPYVGVIRRSFRTIFRKKPKSIQVPTSADPFYGAPSSASPVLTASNLGDYAECANDRRLSAITDIDSSSNHRLSRPLERTPSKRRSEKLKSDAQDSFEPSIWSKLKSSPQRMSLPTAVPDYKIFQQKLPDIAAETDKAVPKNLSTVKSSSLKSPPGLHVKSLTIVTDDNVLSPIKSPNNPEKGQRKFAPAKPRSHTISRYEIASPVHKSTFNHVEGTSEEAMKSGHKLGSPAIRKSLCLEEFGVCSESDSSSQKSGSTEDDDSSSDRSLRSNKSSDNELRRTSASKIPTHRGSLSYRSQQTDALGLMCTPYQQSRDTSHEDDGARFRMSNSATITAQASEGHVADLDSPGYKASSVPTAYENTSNGDNDADDEDVINKVQETSRIVVDYDPRTGRKRINQYVLLRELGRGVHGKVRLALDTSSGQYVAIKIIDKVSNDRRLRMPTGSAQPSAAQGNSPYSWKQGARAYRRFDFDRLEKVKREVAILKKCNHPNIVKLREVIDDPHARRIYLVVEYIAGGEIKWRDEHDRPVFSLDQVRHIFRGLVLGVEYLHYHGIIHRDIKPANLLSTDDGMVKISDFGVSFLRSKPNQRAKAPTSTSFYKAPLYASSKNNATPSTDTPRIHDVAKQSLIDRKPLGIDTRNKPTLGSGQTSGAASMIMPTGSFPVSRSASQPMLTPKDSMDVLPRRLSGSRLFQKREDCDVPKNKNTQSRDLLPFHKNGSYAFGLGGHQPNTIDGELDDENFDPFDISDSDEFFTSDDDDDGSRDIYNTGDTGGSFYSSDDDGALVIGPSKSKSGTPDATSTENSPQKRLDKRSGGGALDAINIDYDEEGEERELAKTAGTPAFFAPELCCTAEELIKLLHDRRMRLLTTGRLLTNQELMHPLTPTGSELPKETVPQSQILGIPSIPTRKPRHHRLATIGSLLARPLGGSPGLVNHHGKRSQSSHTGTPYEGKSPSSNEFPDITGYSVEAKTTAHPKIPYTAGPTAITPNKNVVTPAIDIWAMGITLYCLVCGKVPFKAESEFELFDIVPRKELEFPSDIQLPAELVDLLQRLLDKDYRTRITIEEIKTHPWVIQDLHSPSHWISDTHPSHRPTLSVTEEEMESAVLTVMRKKIGERIKMGVSKISKSIAGLRSRSTFASKVSD